MNKHILILLFLSGTVLSTLAQTYATQELKEQEEKHIAEKNARLGVVPLDDRNLPSQDITPKSAVPDLTGYYQISTLEAVNFDSKHTAAEIKEFKNEALSEIERNNIYISLEYNQLIKIDRSNKEFNIYKITNNTNQIVIDCEKCNTPPFKIVEKTADKLVFLEHSSDEEQIFDFMYTFIK